MHSYLNSALGDLSSHSLIWCFVAFVCGGIIKGALGIGTPLLTVPMLAIVIPAPDAVTLMAVPVVMANLWQASQAPDVPAVTRRFWPVGFALIAGAYLGADVLSTIREQLLLAIVGCIVIAFALLQSSRKKLQLADHFAQPAGILFGAVSGLLGGISSMFGPILILYLGTLRDLDRENFISSISLLYLCAVLPWTAMLIGKGLLSRDMLVVSALACVPVIIGMYVGQLLRGRISDQGFQHLILAVLITSGVSLLWQALRLS